MPPSDVFGRFLHSSIFFLKKWLLIVSGGIFMNAKNMITFWGFLSIVNVFTLFVGIQTGDFCISIVGASMLLYGMLGIYISIKKLEE